MSGTLSNPYFDARNLPTSTECYVAWLDIMGVQATMLRSLPITANAIFKLHTAVLEHEDASLKRYPVMDGVYVSSTDKERIRNFLSAVFGRLGRLVTSTREPEYRFLIKAAVAKGPTIHGEDVRSAASPLLAQHQAYRNSLLLGMPMVQAHLAERSAPPFGVAVHETATDILSGPERRCSSHWWQWYTPGRDVSNLREALLGYFEWAEKRAGLIDYPLPRLFEHRQQVTHYFADSESPTHSP